MELPAVTRLRGLRNKTILFTGLLAIFSLLVAQRAQCGVEHGVDIQLDKVLPMGGGLGGGSSDAATTLLALNQLWGCGLSLPTLMEIGLSLGADVPVFIQGQAA